MVLSWPNAIVVLIKTLILVLLTNVTFSQLNCQNSNLNSADLFARQSLYSLQKILTLYHDSFKILT